LDVFADGVRPGDFAVALFRSPDEGGAAACPSHIMKEIPRQRHSASRDD
jgi:hypothetical protein